MSKLKVKDTDKGFRGLVEALGSAKAAYVVVGVRQEKGAMRLRRTGEPGARKAVADATAPTMVMIATVNEFGSDDGRIPERSFMRSTFDENETKYRARLTKGVRQAIDAALVKSGAGPMVATLERALQLTGVVVARDVQEKIRDLKDPPNAEYTIQQKGSSSPLQDSGRLRQSIDWEVRNERPS